MTIKLYHVDAFTDSPFTGNPAAVCLLSEPCNEAWMQQVAAEMNLSETAFLHKCEDGFSLRWFTPQVEVELCGHATLASAHILWESGLLESGEQARFNTKSGILTANKKEDLIELDFPSRSQEPAVVPDEFISALGCKPKYTGQAQGGGYLIEVESEADVRSLQPDFPTLSSLPGRSVIVTSAASQYDFISRFFAPWVGIDEDPVTGSAHCVLGPYWSKELGRKRLVGYQASKRGGIVHVEVKGDRVHLRGTAITITRGELIVSFQ